MYDVVNTILEKGLVGDMLICNNYFPATEYENKMIEENLPLFYNLKVKLNVPINAEDLALLAYVYAVIDYCRKGGYELSTYVSNRLITLKRALFRMAKYRNRISTALMLSNDTAVFDDSGKTHTENEPAEPDKYGGYYENSEVELFEIMDECLKKWCGNNKRHMKDFDSCMDVFNFIKILIHNVVKYNVSIPDFCRWYYTKISINTTYVDENGDITHRCRAAVNHRLKNLGNKLKETGLEEAFREKLKEVCEYAEVQS